MNYKIGKKYAFILVIVAYVFSIVVRLYYYFWAKNIPEFIWNNTLIINNVDGYYYAAGAYEILHNSHVIGDLNPIHSFPSILTAVIVKLFPFLSLDQVILWMPAIFGSLVVVPVYLIGRSLKNDFLGFGAALISGIAWSYYNRTMIGYYDTDMLVITLLMFVIWGTIEWFENKTKLMYIIVPLFIILFELWYPQSRTYLLAYFFLLIIYWYFKDRSRDSLFLLLLIGVAIFHFPLYINAIIILLLLIVFNKIPSLLYNNKFLYLLIFLVILGDLFSGTLNVLMSEINAYINRKNNNILGLHYYHVYKTIREASAIPYDLVAKRISGNEILFGLSAIGYVLMLIRWPVFIITLPFVGMGIMAHKMGLRFTIYAVPFFALGLVYLGFRVSELIKTPKIYKLIIPFFLVSISLFYNIKHVIYYKTPTTFIKPEVASLNKLSKIAKPEDYVVTWWDYGYPIRYYAHTKTLIDGGKHSGADNFPVSFILTHNQIAAANMARLDVELTDKIEVQKELGKYDDNRSLIQIMMDKYGYKNPNAFLNALNNSNFKLPKKTRDVYLYLPFRMTDIYPTVAIFSSIDLLTGKVKQPVILATSVRGISNRGIVFSNGIVLDNRGNLIINNQIIPINSFYISDYKNNKFIVKKNKINPNSNIYVLWYRPLNKVLIVDKKIFNSTYVQMFFLQKYNKEIFEPVILNPYVKIYKLKK
ncbi:STT3 domain-containing protein [Caminibacter mediatlanticus]|uniref:Oligosaccharyl transferase, STT3 subunit n=1 Tax=Caminibacter mediatlanticus TB-2 TaxID=391592 RepID=A0AAI9AGG8_9BACT|nr:STT3 domain-containing protein [Caminibacter mediatlanticus]EDM23170.1 Oligosaccharyl transferase, STT3 subunit [Caminibacter mediatlanticus TB-2]